MRSTSPCRCTSSRTGSRIVALLLFAAVALAACEPAEPPQNYRIVDLYGTPYEQGFQHGQMFRNEIRSFYTMLLTNSLLPYLNRERPDIAEFLLTYADDKYADGNFSRLVLLESGQNIEPYIPGEYIEEMQGIADGADLPYDDILLLNTMFDSIVGLRAMTFFIRAIQAPVVAAVDFGDLSNDGVDNDGDGEIDEAGEGRLDPFDPSQYASMIEVPEDATITIYLEDDDGVATNLVRYQVNMDVYWEDAPEMSTSVYGESGEGLEVALTPTNLEAAGEYTIYVAAGDDTWVTDPPPGHARMMRDMRITFTTQGDGREIHAVKNRGVNDGRFQPPASAFAVRDSATTDGRIRLGTHFSLLDTNTIHKHTALFIHHTEDGYSHATVGWVGTIFGFSGMNSEGLSYAVTYDDTLNNPIAKEFLTYLFYAQIKTSGIPVGIMGREILKHFSTVEDATQWLSGHKPTFGWNWLLADRDRDFKAIETHANVLDDATNLGFHAYDADTGDASNYDEYGEMLASVGPDDLRIAAHYQYYRNDIDYEFMGFHLQPQRYWTSFYFRSVRNFYELGDIIDDNYGGIDTQEMMSILGDPEVADQRDSMNAAVFEPETGLLHFAMGQVPATSKPFITVDLNEHLAGGGQ